MSKTPDQNAGTTPEKSHFTRRGLIKSGAAAAALSVTPLPQAMSAMKSALPSNLTWVPGCELVNLIADKQLSPVELTKHFLHRIEKHDRVTNAFVTVDHEGAMKQAKAAEAAVMRGAALGPLHGLPISIKDLVETKGLRTTFGSSIYKDFIPSRDEVLVARLRAAGAIILGKTNTPEFGKFPRTKTYVGAETFNPWDTSRISGASSGGSGAAIAAGLSCYDVGSDGGGSTRIPACFNGVFGMQPSAGRIPSRIPRSVTTSSRGPVTIHVRDAAIFLQVMSGYHPLDPSSIEQPAPNFAAEVSAGIEGFKIAWTPDFGVIPIIDKRVIHQIAKSAAKLTDAGAIVDAPQITLPDKKAWQVFLTVNQTSNRVGESLLKFTPEEQAQLTPPLAAMLKQVKQAPRITKAMEIAMLEDRAFLQHWLDVVFAKYDLICTPTTGIIAPKVPQEAWAQPYTDSFYASHISTCYTYIANVLGLPAASVPCGFVDGMPVGLQIIGRRFDDVKVMRAAQAFATIQPWMDKHPTQFT